MCFTVLAVPVQGAEAGVAVVIAVVIDVIVAGNDADAVHLQTITTERGEDTMMIDVGGPYQAIELVEPMVMRPLSEP